MSTAANNRTPGDLANEIGIKGEQAVSTLLLIITNISGLSDKFDSETNVLFLVKDTVQQMCALAEQLELQVTS